MGDLIGHFLSKMRLIFRSKTFPENNALTQKRSNVQDDNDVTKQSLSFIPSIEIHGYFGAIDSRRTFNFFNPFYGSERKKNIRIGFLLNAFKHFVALTWLKKKLLNLGSFDI